MRPVRCLQVLGLNVDNAGMQALTSFTNELHMTYQIAQADKAIQAKFGIKSVPTIYVIDKKGNIAEIFRNVDNETGRNIESLVKKLLTDE